MWLVLISRHFYDDAFTNQFGIYVRSGGMLDARAVARSIYPSVYVMHPVDKRLVAYFTGSVQKV